MALALPNVRVGDPQRFEALSVFPLFTASVEGVDYLLSDEALTTNLIRVEEISEQGSVPDLLVENKSDSRVLFLEGEELIGAKQNRILNTSVLIAAKSKVRIPVSCVERGRWGYRGKTFSSSGRHSPSKLRRAVKASVGKSLKDNMGFHSDQSEVWRQVASYDAAFCVRSPTGAMSDTFEAMEARLAEAKKSLQYVSGASGVAIALGKDVVCVELFDKPSTCQKVWERALSGFILDALNEGLEPDAVDAMAVEEVIRATLAAQWAKVDAVGEGEEYRAEFGKEHASALCFNDQLVHGSVVGA